VLFASNWNSQFDWRRVNDKKKMLAISQGPSEVPFLWDLIIDYPQLTGDIQREDREINILRTSSHQGKSASHSTLMFRILSFLHLCFGENSFAKSWILRIYSEAPRSFLVCVTRHTMHNPCQFRLNIGALSIRPYRWQIGCWPLDLQRFQSPEASG
jgi:hypothetical protein